MLVTMDNVNVPPDGDGPVTSAGENEQSVVASSGSSSSTASRRAPADDSAVQGGAGGGQVIDFFAASADAASESLPAPPTSLPVMMPGEPEQDPQYNAMLAASHKGHSIASGDYNTAGSAAEVVVVAKDEDDNGNDDDTSEADDIVTNLVGIPAAHTAMRAGGSMVQVGEAGAVADREKSGASSSVGLREISGASSTVGLRYRGGRVATTHTLDEHAISRRKESFFEWVRLSFVSTCVLRVCVGGGGGCALSAGCALSV
jgi:hypothetical protein